MAAPAGTESTQGTSNSQRPKKSKSQKKKQNDKAKEKAEPSKPEKDTSQQAVGSGDENEHDEGAPDEDAINHVDARPNGSTASNSVNLRKELENLKSQHVAELQAANERLEEAQSGREQAEAQYQSLLEKVGTIKSQLGERLKADAEELSQARAQIEELELDHQQDAEKVKSLEATIAKMSIDEESSSKELSSLRNRTNLSQQNWLHEREDLVNREAYLREEFEAAKQAMQDWEILAMEERSVREGLTEKVADMQEQLSAQQQEYEITKKERDNQSMTVDGLQRALQELQSARKSELRQLVESNQKQVDDLRKQLQESQALSTESKSLLETVQKDLDRVLPFEKEVKEKNLLIGKLRHEAVILNDHLTKALRFLKKGKPEDNVDRQIVTNHFLHFLALDRADPKKFQILQLIAALLDWTEEQREQAGLTRPGAPGGSLRPQMSPFLRTPSSPALSSELSADTANRESLAELWSNFLEQEAGANSKAESSSSKPKP